MCSEFTGKERPIEDTLNEWIANWLICEWVHGTYNIFSAEDRPPEHSQQRCLLQEYGWPAGFPLDAETFKEFLVRKREISRQAN